MSYDFDWHEMHGERTEQSARRVLGWLHEATPYASVLDVGCGDGRWLARAQAAGAAEILGLDGPWTDREALRIPRAAFREADLSAAVDLGRRFDLAISLEVAEHVPPESSEIFVQNLVRHADCVLFGGAIPYQGGYRHINERWQSYWAGLFAGHGYRVLDPFRALLWEDEDIHFWYRQNMLLYIREERADLIAGVEAWMASRGTHPLPIDMVHPSKFESIASYDQIAFKPLLRRLPDRVWRKAGQIFRREI